MGVVYEAQQISLGRRVALKVLPFAAVLDSRQIARFKHEAQAAAQLDHPNIVSVFAVGVDRGVHYYAMQFIDGQPLDRALAELRGTSSSGLTANARRNCQARPSNAANAQHHRLLPGDSRLAADCQVRQSARVLPHRGAFGDPSGRGAARGA